MKNYFTTTLLLISFFSFSQKIDTSYAENKKRAIKIEFFSPLTGNTTLGYESYLKDWISWELKVGAIGLGIDPDNLNASGVFIKGGPKFKLNPDFITPDLRGSHLLSGKYIRPEIIFSSYSENVEEYNGFDVIRKRKGFTSIGLMINYGQQYVLANVMTLDYHIGLGYASNSSGEGRYYYGYSAGNSEFPLAISAGFTIGVLLK